jgi:glutamate mutase epsilon subunit
MAKILQKKTPLSADEKLNIEKALEFQDSAEVASVSAKAKVIALAHLNYYYEDNPEAAIKTLQDNKDVIKKIVNPAKVNTSDESLNYVNEKLLKDTKSVLIALFVRGYPDNQGPSSDKAYELLKEFHLL